MTHYYEHAGITIYHGDALAVLSELPPGSVDVLATDPPYSSGGMTRGDRAQGVHAKYVQNDSELGNALPTFSGDNRDQRAFALWEALWIGETRRIVKAGCIAALFTDWRQLPTTTDALQVGGYVWRGIVPWHKPGARPTQGRWSNACEYVAWGTNGPRELTGRAFPGFFQANAPTCEERSHITQKPLSLMVELLAIVPAGGVVLDPFIGSGTTLEAAKQLGLRAIGVEIEECYCEIAARRLSQEVLPL